MTSPPAKPCSDVFPHEPHIWRPDGKRITSRSRPDALRQCPGRAAAPTSMTEAVTRELDQLNRPNVAVAQLALVLAAQLDAGAGLATAAVARELRAALAELRAAHDRHDDPTAGIEEAMSTPVVDPPAT